MNCKMRATSIMIVRVAPIDAQNKPPVCPLSA